MSAPEPVAIKAWGEMPGERNLPGVLRVLVAGQHAGGAEPDDGQWRAHWMTGKLRDRSTLHATADEAIAAVLASPFARRLGVRKASRVYWSERAKRRAGGAR